MNKLRTRKHESMRYVSRDEELSKVRISLSKKMGISLEVDSSSSKRDSPLQKPDTPDSGAISTRTRYKTKKACKTTPKTHRSIDRSTRAANRRERRAKEIRPPPPSPTSLVSGSHTPCGLFNVAAKQTQKETCTEIRQPNNDHLLISSDVTGENGGDFAAHKDCNTAPHAPVGNREETTTVDRDGGAFQVSEGDVEPAESDQRVQAEVQADGGAVSLSTDDSGRPAGKYKSDSYAPASPPRQYILPATPSPPPPISRPSPPINITVPPPNSNLSVNTTRSVEVGPIVITPSGQMRKIITTYTHVIKRDDHPDINILTQQTAAIPPHVNPLITPPGLGPDPCDPTTVNKILGIRLSKPQPKRRSAHSTPVQKCPCLAEDSSPIIEWVTIDEAREDSPISPLIDLTGQSTPSQSPINIELSTDSPMADTSDLLDTPMRADYQLPYQTSPPRHYRSATPMPVSSDSSTGSCSILTLSEILDKLERERPKAKAFREMGQRTRSAPPCDRATETPTKRRQPCDQRTRQPENMHRPVSEYSPGSTHESMKCGLDMEDDTSRPSTPLAEATATAARTVSQVAHDDDSEPRNVVHKHIPEVVNVSEDVASTQITDEAPAILGFLPPRLEKGKVVIFLPAPPDMFCPCCPQNYPPLLHSKGLGERVRRMENHVWDRHRRRSIIRCLGCGDDVNDRRHIKKCRFLKHKLTTFTNRPARWRYVAGPARDTNGRLMRPALEEHRVIIPIPANEVLVCPICDDRISSAIAESSRRFSLKKHLCRAHGVEEVALICGGCDTEVRDWRTHKKECEKGRKIAPPPTPREMMPARCAYRDCELLFATAKQAALHFRVHATEQRRQRADANKFKPNTARARSQRILEAIIGPKGMHQTNSENDINEGDNRSDCSRASGEEPPAPALDDKQKADQESTLQPQQNTQQQQGMDPTQGSTSADGHGHTLHHGLTKAKHQRGRRPEAGVRPPTSKASRTFFNSALSPEEVNRIQDQLTNKAPQRSNNRQVRTPLGSKEERRAQMVLAPTEQQKWNK